MGGDVHANGGFPVRKRVLRVTFFPGDGSAEIWFYLHKECRVAEIWFYLRKEFRAAGVRFYLHKELLKNNIS